MGATPLTACLACGSSDLRIYLDLGSTPLANAFTDGSKNLPRYPLAVNVCLRCSHSQLTHAVDPEEMFADYPYVSGTSATLAKYFRDFVEQAESDFGGKRLQVLDIGCNDGSLLKAFAEKGHAVFGVDPAAHLLPAEIPCVAGYWNEQSLARLERLCGGKAQFDVIIAMNVLAHNADPLDFLAQCRKALAPGGRVYVQTSQADFLENAEFDCVYHEHISYFSELSLMALAHRTGFGGDFRENPAVHGGSLLVALSKAPSPYEATWFPPSDWLTPYETMQERVILRCQAAHALIERGGVGKKMVGYGAAAKAMTMLNYAGGIAGLLAYVVDDNPLKQGMVAPFMAGSGQRVFPSSVLADEACDLCIAILAWNFADEIIAKVKAIRPGRNDVFVQVFPHLRVRR